MYQRGQVELKTFKVCLTCTRVLFLGHYVMHDGIEVHCVTTPATQNLPTPLIVKDARAFWGLVIVSALTFPVCDNRPDKLDQNDVKLLRDEDCE